MRSIQITVLASASLLAACASSPEPRELLDARVAYQQAASGPASQLDPAQLHVANEALAAAEQSYRNDGDSYRTRDRAYIALRNAQLADARARTVEYDQEVNLAAHQVQTTQAQEVATATGMLSSERQELEKEKQQRAAAEKRAAQAMADLARIAAVKQDVRGTVITLAGGVLFASAKYDLLPTAQTNLAQVADALSKSDPDSKITVAGYTDSQGGEAYNLELSQHRADAVRSFLVSHGVAPDRITAQGFGPAQPVADNASPEGRADNRRVEIVVQPASPRVGSATSSH
jgi:outer membrane protein OmpA-like peptidoglycan-associated protein